MEEILIALKHAKYFEDNQMGLEFIEQFIQQVLTPFVNKHAENENEMILG